MPRGIKMKTYAKNIKLKNADEIVKKYYLQFLCVITYMDKNSFDSKIALIKQIATNIEYKLNEDEIEMLGIDFNSEKLNNMIPLVKEHKYSFIVDSFVIANLSSKLDENVISAIISIAEELDFIKEDIEVLSTLAGCIMKDNYDDLDKLQINSSKWLGVVSEYIPENWLEKRRMECDKAGKILRATRDNALDYYMRNEENQITFNMPPSYTFLHKGDKIAVRLKGGNPYNDPMGKKLYETAERLEDRFSLGFDLLEITYISNKDGILFETSQYGLNGLNLTITNRKTREVRVPTKEDYPLKLILDYNELEDLKFYIVSCFEDEERFKKWYEKEVKKQKEKS